MEYRFKDFEKEKFTQEDSDAIKSTAYARYQYRWLYSNGYSMTDLSNLADVWLKEREANHTNSDFYDFIAEHGMDADKENPGNCYYDYDSFLKSYYLDEDFMSELFVDSENLAIMYFLDRVYSGIDNEEDLEDEVD